jgi:hypothetical protein
MGSRALFHITDGHRSGYYWLHWGSPAYQIPNLATFIHHCRTRGIHPTVEIFEDFARTFTDGQLPTEKVPATCWTNRNSTDAENRYQLNLDSGQPVRLHAEIIRWLPGPPQWHTVCQTTDDDQLYQAAADARDQMATEIRRQLTRNPNMATGPHPVLPDPAQVQADADTYRRWATAATTAPTTADQPPS